MIFLDFFLSFFIFSNEGGVDFYLNPACPSMHDETEDGRRILSDADSEHVCPISAVMVCISISYGYRVLHM